ncbi:hypothetical protein F4553_003292 [Allocatelliglobosispora scoriae]|uniref:Bacterial Ig-like domain-containing protein n=1 Tax=Allocatelliglobosispora scoriae TaxID=643052 RepID=A0A841BSL5_9ACTN|nr:Ig-like domain-containing protein [Allocatelliglobosispora scoriae]MBB5869913.1 hypothetical protein [Allocatelliglobosispora scoriae]
MFSTFKRSLGVAVVAGMAMTGSLLLSAAPASAAVVGTLTVTPATGTDNTPATVNTSAACPAGTNIIGRITGAGFTTAQTVRNNSPISSYSVNAAGGLVVPLADTFRAFGNLQSPPVVFAGKYDIVISCIAPLAPGTSLGDFVGSVWFTSNTAYQSTDPTTTPTTTTLATTPAGPVSVGTSVTLTATVAPAAATGSVQFFDGAASLGTSPVSGGTASISTSALTAGSHSLTAVFTGTGNFEASTSAPKTFVVNGPATPTTTALAVSPASSSQQYGNVALTVTVSPTAAGSVQFLDGATALGTVAVSGGTATLTVSTLALGSHSLVAAFTPANPASFTASTSAAIDYTITAFTGATASETITTTVEAGALVISVADSSVVLASPTLNTAGDLLVTSGQLKPVTITDTRAGNFGWNVSGQVTDFLSSGSNTINGANLGWGPTLIDKATAQTVTPGATVAAAHGVAPGAASTEGLKVSRTLAVGLGLGTAHLGASLALNAPTSTLPGTYTATLTLTVI